MNKERLLKLASFLDTLPPERFDIQHWVRYDWGGKPDLSCGTSACALGWATTIPEFREAGLRLRQTTWGFVGVWCPGVEETDSHHHSMSQEAAQVFFGLAKKEADRIFMPDYYDYDGEDVKPVDVAERIREVCGVDS